MNAITNAELDAFYGVPLSPMALEHGQQSVTDDMELVSEFITEGSDERLPCKYFGPIATSDLVRQVILNRCATPEQCKAACMEFRDRLLAHYSERVQQAASRAMEP